MIEVIGCPICGTAVTDSEQHSDFHRRLDASLELLHDVEHDATEALLLIERTRELLDNQYLAGHHAS